MRDHGLGLRRMDLANLVCRLPFNSLRVLGYRLLGLRIGRNVRIGYKAHITSKTCVIGDDVMIGGRNNISVGEFRVGAGARIHSGNSFVGRGRIELGRDVKIYVDAYFDGWNSITVGDGTWIAKSCQFWTHGATKMTPDTSIVIGKGAYIAAAVLFAPGAGVGDGAFVGLGAVVTKRFPEPNCWIVGNPAAVVQSGYSWKEFWQ
ncbi:MAG: hypothetical protein HY921_00155 [Elusimicrobia bacterium]|nr:hypothetical protein [Elusimicrobiota bacterium]